LYTYTFVYSLGEKNNFKNTQFFIEEKFNTTWTSLNIADFYLTFDILLF